MLVFGTSGTDTVEEIMYAASPYALSMVCEGTDSRKKQKQSPRFVWKI